MATYQVRWEIDVEAESAERAAAKIWRDTFGREWPPAPDAGCVFEVLNISDFGADAESWQFADTVDLAEVADELALEPDCITPADVVGITAYQGGDATGEPAPAPLVRIAINGGVASVLSRPPGVAVEVRDYDREGDGDDTDVELEQSDFAGQTVEVPCRVSRWPVDLEKKGEPPLVTPARSQIVLRVYDGVFGEASGLSPGVDLVVRESDSNGIDNPDGQDENGHDYVERFFEGPKP